ncbi:MAG: hypothetical protein KUF79_20710, partial [Candidatus Thiodiazotropha sp. (ex Ctena orbiculata)]|nr:hypothetical protein [Candidatus Thiodiazotropha taylori]
MKSETNQFGQGAQVSGGNLFIDIGNLQGQLFDLTDNRIVGGTVHMREIVLPLFIDGNTEGVNSLAPGLEKGLCSIPATNAIKGLDAWKG